MSELSVGQLKGLAVNNNKITVPTGHTLNAPGHVIQVVSTSIMPSTTQTTSSSYQYSGLGLDITLKSSTSKVLIMVNGGHGYNVTNSNGLLETICRQASTTYDSSKDLAVAAYGLSQIYGGSSLTAVPHSMQILDSPGTTNPSYKVFFRSRTSGSNVVWQEGNSYVTMTLLEIGQ